MDLSETDEERDELGELACNSNSTREDDQMVNMFDPDLLEQVPVFEMTANHLEYLKSLVMSPCNVAFAWSASCPTMGTVSSDCKS